MGKNKITLPKTKGELSTSHYFSAFIYPQVLNANNVFTNIIYRNYTNILAGVTKVEKSFKKDVFERRKLGDYEIIQIIPQKVEYGLTLKKVVFYKDVNNEIAKFLEIEGNGLIKQFVPLIIQEFVKDPNGQIKEITTYFDCWIIDDRSVVDIETDDLLITKSLNVKVAKMVTRNNNNVGVLKDMVNLGMSAVETFTNIPSGVENVKNIIQNFRF